jgi:hypothetical protein
VQEALRLCGVDEVHAGIGKTGVVGVIHGRSNTSGRMIGLRADMDALTMTENNEFPWKSTRAGMMHGCGHDGHTAMLVGAARYLAETRNFDGTAVLIFQPGEEGFAGAKAMIEDGLFERFPVEAVYAMHNWPGLPPGTFGIRPGRDDGLGRPRHHRDHRQGRPRRPSLPRRRPGAGGRAHHHRRAEHRLAQRAAHRRRRHQPVRDAGRRPARHERHPRQGDAGGHGAHLHAPRCRTWWSAA